MRPYRRPFFGPLRAAVAILSLYASILRAQVAQDSVSYKYHNYQEDNGRIKVESHYTYVDVHPTLSTDVRLMGLVDTISGSTPIGTPAPEGSTQVPLTYLTDRRWAESIDVVQQVPWGTVDAKLYHSQESDYHSMGYALNGTWDLNGKNTTLSAGFAYDDDNVAVIGLGKWLPKLTNSYFIGVTQLINPETWVGINYTYVRRRGYQSDPYKIIQKTVEVLPGLFVETTPPENRPELRDVNVLQLNGMHYFKGAHASLGASYRFFMDDWGITGHTVETTWNQKLGDRWVISPTVRYYLQSRADFYYPTLDGTPIDPSPDYVGGAPYYSSDHRLAKMSTLNLGVTVTFQATDWLELNAAVERYTMHNRDNLAPDSAFSNATIVNVGATVRW